jgi:hypothetical protein
MNAEPAMNEQEQYECFGIPSHVWVENDAAAVQAPPASTRPAGIARDVFMLGAEAMPSPLIQTL